MRSDHYLGRGFSTFVEARTFLFTGTARVGILYHPCDGGYLPFTLDLVHGRLIGPNVGETLETGFTLSRLYLTFGAEPRRVLGWFLK